MMSEKKSSKSSRSSRKTKRPSGSRSTAHHREVPLAKVKDDLSRFLRLAADGDIVITRHGKPAGVLIGFASDEEWFEYRLANHPEFLRRVAEARAALREGYTTRLEDLK